MTLCINHNTIYGILIFKLFLRIHWYIKLYMRKLKSLHPGWMYIVDVECVECVECVEWSHSTHSTHSTDSHLWNAWNRVLRIPRIPRIPLIAICGMRGMSGMTSFHAFHAFHAFHISYTALYSCYRPWSCYIYILIFAFWYILLLMTLHVLRLDRFLYIINIVVIVYNYIRLVYWIPCIHIAVIPNQETFCFLLSTLFFTGRGRFFLFVGVMSAAWRSTNLTASSSVPTTRLKHIFSSLSGLRPVVSRNVLYSIVNWIERFVCCAIVHTRYTHRYSVIWFEPWQCLTRICMCYYKILDCNRNHWLVCAIFLMQFLCFVLVCMLVVWH